MLIFCFFFAISWLIFGVFSSSLLLQGVGDDFLFLQALVCFWDPSSSMASLDALIFFFFFVTGLFFFSSSFSSLLLWHLDALILQSKMTSFGLYGSKTTSFGL